MSARHTFLVPILSLIFLCEIHSIVIHKNKNHENTDNTWVLSHVLFRHGNRTPEPTELYPKDPYLNYKYYPLGNGQLTNAGKQREYSIGKALRERYGRILGEYFFPDVVDARSTDYDRTKMSLELVLASLFPPRREEQWQKNLYWQPAPFNFSSRNHDRVLLGTECPNYKRLYNQQINSPKQQQEFRQYKTVFNYISQHSGLNVTKFEDVYNLYFGLKTESEWGFVLPKWTEPVLDEIQVLATKHYFVSSATADLRRLASGYFLQKLLSDTRDVIECRNTEKRLFLYSAHENNIAELLIVLGIFGKPHVPNYGSYVNIEVHRTENNRHGIKIFYENYVYSEPQLLTLPGCEVICDLEKVEQLVGQYIPNDGLCGDQ